MGTGPKDANKMLSPLLTGEADHVISNRFADMEDDAMTRLNSVGNRLAQRAFELIYHHSGDVLSGYHAFTRESIERIDLSANGFGIETEMAVECSRRGIETVEVPITYCARPEGTESKLNPLRDGATIWLTIYSLAKTSNPLFYFGSVGTLAVLSGGGVALFVGYQWFAEGVSHEVLALVEADHCDLARDDAKRLVEQVNSEYFIAIPTQPARLEQLPIDDQLTADWAQQYGFALHELGHIRYTSIVESAALLNDAIEDTHQDFVHSLWNLCEDATIEHQLAADQSQIAANRLTLLNQSLSPRSTALCEDTPRQCTFRDAVERALFDWGIYETGLLDVLCDPEDDRLIFQSVADRQAYEYVVDDLRQLLADILTTPESIARTERVLECWQKVLKPLLDPIDDEEPSQPFSDDASDIDPSAGSDAFTTDATATSTESEGTDAMDSIGEHSLDENPPTDTPEQAGPCLREHHDPHRRRSTPSRRKTLSAPMHLSIPPLERQNQPSTLLRTISLIPPPTRQTQMSPTTILTKRTTTVSTRERPPETSPIVNRHPPKKI